MATGTSSSSINTDSNAQRLLKALKLLTLSVVCLTLHEILQFQQSIYRSSKGINGDSLNGRRDLQSKSNSISTIITANDEANSNSNFIPLTILTRVDQQVVCPDERLFPVPIVSNTTADSPSASHYLIPRIVHQTGEIKCMTKPFFDNAKAWSFEGSGWSFYFHDNKARQALLEKFWPEFPQLQNAFQCLQNAGGAAIADLWRYLALWEYGGFYTDMDNELGGYINASTVNKIFAPHIDAFFLQDKAGSPGFPTQHFFGISPKHPLMYFAVYQVLQGMLGLQEVGNFDVPEVTGPSALDRAFLEFMNVPKSEFDEKTKQIRHPLATPTRGTYVGVMNRTVTIKANKESLWAYIRVSSIHGQRKREGWKLMGFNDYHAMNKVPQNKTCLEVIMEHHMERLGMIGSQ